MSWPVRQHLWLLPTLRKVIMRSQFDDVWCIRQCAAGILVHLRERKAAASQSRDDAPSVAEGADLADASMSEREDGPLSEDSCEIE